VSYLTYYGDDVPHFEPPNRVYARVDRREPPDGEPDDERTIVFDSIDADWIDELRGGADLRWLGSSDLVDEVDRRVSVVEATFGRAEFPPEGRTPEGRWIEIQFVDDGLPVLHFLNLFAAPLERGASGWVGVDSGLEEDLERITGVGDIPEIDDEEVARALISAMRFDAVAVYDVGQGSCTALLENGIPQLYFDFGGGVRNNTRTYPATLKRFCLTADPLIVLSHWDEDHWSSAQRFTAARGCTWLVPNQGALGPTHVAFLGNLHRSGRVLVWPSQLSSMRVQGVTIERCTGPASSRNDSGLAMIVESSNGRMLFPGDAGYQNVPSAVKDFTSVVVPHHGGRTPRRQVVAASDNQSHGRLVYSYGPGNTYRHPLARVVADHHPVWSTDLRTEHRHNGGLGHVHLYWSAGQAPAHPACRGRQCDLTCHQR
jgi:beta-lactamase superfamily II metal-dependent hydrolase